MKIQAGMLATQVNGIFQESKHQDGKVLEVLNINVPVMLTDEEMQVLLNNPISFLPDDNGEAAQTFKGFNTVKGYSLSLIRETDAEKEMQSLRAEQETVKQEKAMLLSKKEVVAIE